MLTYLRPSGAGSLTQLTPTDGANYQCVDEDVADDEDYVYYECYSAGTVTKTDSYALPNPSIRGVINSVTVCYRVGASVGGGATKAAYKIGSTYSSYTDLTTSWVNRTGTVYTTNPDTSAAWTLADLNDLQIGVSLRTVDGYGETVYCSLVYAVVDSTEPGTRRRGISRF